LEKRDLISERSSRLQAWRRPGGSIPGKLTAVGRCLNSEYARKAQGSEGFNCRRPSNMATRERRSQLEILKEI
jgi:hypothetical protein